MDEIKIGSIWKADRIRIGSTTDFLVRIEFKTPMGRYLLRRIDINHEYLASENSIRENYLLQEEPIEISSEIETLVERLKKIERKNSAG